MDRSQARLLLRVSPGARLAGVVGRHGDAWKIRVSAVAERGRANREVIDLLGRALGLPPERLELVAGRASRDKVVVARGIAAADAETRLAAAAGERR